MAHGARLARDAWVASDEIPLGRLPGRLPARSPATCRATVSGRLPGTGASGVAGGADGTVETRPHSGRSVFDAPTGVTSVGLVLLNKFRAATLKTVLYSGLSVA